MNRLLEWSVGARLRGAAAWIVTVVRVVTGALFVSFSTGKFVDHSQEAVDFDRYGIPAPEFSTYAVGTLELVCGLLLVIGLLTRPAASALALNMVGAISTAGRIDGGSFHLGVAPAMLVAMAFLVWAGSGRFALDRRIAARLSPAGRGRPTPTSPSTA